MPKHSAGTTGHSDDSDRTLDAQTSVEQVGATDQGQMGSQAFPEPSAEQVVEARKEGVLDAIKSSTEEAFKRGANEGYGDAPGPDGEQPAQRIVVDSNVLFLRDALDGDADALRERVKPDLERPLTEGQIAGLLEMERSGRNRTEHVEVLCQRLGIKSPYEVTNAGPAWMNDTTGVTKLQR